MWSGGSEFDVYVGTRAIAVSRGVERVLAQQVDSVDAALGALRQWVHEGTERARLRTWLSGGLARPFIVPEIAGVKGNIERQQVARSLAPQHTGLGGDCAVWIDAGSRVAVAVQETTLERLLALCADAPRAHRIASIRPWWSEALRWKLAEEPETTALAAQDCDSLTVLAGRGGGFEVATTLSPVADAETAEAALARQMLSADIAEDRLRLARLRPLRADTGERREGLALSHWMEWPR